MHESEIYQPLEPGEVRLMRMNHVPDSFIDCELGTFHIDRMPTYTALSYCWTKMRATCAIKLNQKTYMVRPNLFDYLELMSKERQDCWIFIDALCIHQNDLFERGHQVRLMGRIYAGATEVISWLGSTESIMWARIQSTESGSSLARLHELCSNEHELSKLERDGHGTPSHTILATLGAAFLEWQYWTRAWIVQEIILARSLIFRVQFLRIRSDLFYMCLERVLTLGLSREYRDISLHAELHTWVDPAWVARDAIARTAQAADKREARAAALAYKMMANRQRLQNDFRNSFRTTLLSATLTFATQHCEETFDRVFGFLGLCHSRLPADYSMPCLELYLRVIVEGITEYVAKALVDGEQPHTNSVTFMSLLFCVFSAHALDLKLHQPLVALATSMAIDHCNTQWADSQISSLHMKQIALFYDDLTKARPWRRVRQLRLRSAKTQLDVISKFGMTVHSPGKDSLARTAMEWKLVFRDIINDPIHSKEAILKGCIERQLGTVKKHKHMSAQIDEIVRQCEQILSNSDRDGTRLLQLVRVLSEELSTLGKLLEKVQNNPPTVIMEPRDDYLPPVRNQSQPL